MFGISVYVLPVHPSYPKFSSIARQLCFCLTLVKLNFWKTVKRLRNISVRSTSTTKYRAEMNHNLNFVMLVAYGFSGTCPLISKRDWIEQLIVLSFKFLLSGTLISTILIGTTLAKICVLLQVRMCSLARAKAEHYLTLSEAINLGERNVSAIAFREGVMMKIAW